MRRCGRVFAFVLVVVVLLVGRPALLAAHAQPADQTEAAREGYVPVKDLPAAEQLPAAPLVIGAYAFIWIGVMAYLWTIWRRLAAVDRELALLRQTIERR
ncbi:MAG TPA: CcmD family protein [Vicinamibacterales bacterium]|jgi:CcmD family protein|nr:CcmD family protein [Vicinamibacterales bacterium]